MFGEHHDSGKIARPFDLAAAPGDPSRAAQQGSLARQLARGDARAAVSFAGQGVDWLPELTRLVRAEPWVRPWVEVAEAVLGELATAREARWSGLLDSGVALGSWLSGERVPTAAYLASTPISMPLILLTQVARYHAALRRGLGSAVDKGGLVAFTGYSQGLAAAALCAEHPASLPIERLTDYLRMMAWHGFYAGAASRDAAPAPPEASPMAAVIGPDRTALEAAIAQVVGRLGAESVTLAIANDLKRHAVSGTPEGLAALRLVLEARAAKEAEAKRAGRHGGRVLTLAWEPIATSAGFHSPLVLAGYEQMLEKVDELGFAVGRLELPVYDPGAETPLHAAAHPTESLLGSIFLHRGHWQRTLLAMARAHDLDVVLDCGPGEDIARLSAGALRGTGAEVVALVDDVARERLYSAPRPPRPVRYDSFAPRLARLADGRVVIDNAFTRATGTPPVILPGMTPTTVDAPIVAAAANAGFTAELAGGGQVTERIFHERMTELGELLEPGVGVAFNALLLDSYLWGLHLGDKKLVQRARAQGHPISGVTVTAGIPAVDDAVRLLDELAALGATRNAFKPGTKSQVEQVVAIARAAPQHTLFVHLEGGRAGGHHSWEDLDALLLDTYPLVRAEKNLVLCVGGGIKDEARATALLLGTWSEAHGLPRMPVDAVLLGTLTMAVREATASAAVKEALVAAPGTDAWVLRGAVKGGVTSGQSQLNADIHYLENAAARCGRLLDEVAGDAAKVAARKDEIVLALNATAKPYFGDAAEMTYAALLERLLELLAIGRGGRYEDGVWPDASYRQRFLDMLRRSEARLAGLAGLEHEVPSVAPRAEALDDPRAVLDAFLAACPAAATTRLHPADLTFFVKDVCARPGKPVGFVPVIDADVRRWYKADSLWQAQDPRWTADQVLVIPGPEAIAGITRADEPVAELLGRFDRAVVRALEQAGEVARDADRLLPSAARAAALPAGVTLNGEGTTWTLRVEDPARAAGWLAWAAARCRGPVAALLDAEWIAEGPRLSPSPLRRLLLATDGAELTLHLGPHERLDRAVYETPDGERVTLTRDSDRQATLALAWTDPDAPDFVLPISATLRGGHYTFDVAAGGMDRAVGEMYRQTLFETPGAPAPLFAPARDEVEVEPEHALAYRRVTGWRAANHRPGDVAVNQVFSLAWPTVYRTLSCDELVGGLLRLVHLDNAVTPLAGWPLTAGETLAVEARVTRVEDGDDRRVATVVAELSRGAVPVARMTSRFFIRGRFGDGPEPVRGEDRLERRVVLADEAAARFLATHDGVSLRLPVAAGDALVVRASLSETRRRSGPGRFAAQGEILRDGVQVGQIALSREAELAEHPLTALLHVLGAFDDGVRATPRRTLARAEATAPSDMSPFAEVGGDLNPIHRSALAARLAGLDQPIVHGMWTAARLHAFVAEDVCHGDAARVRDFSVQFLAPVLPGETLHLTAVRVGVVAGTEVVDALAAVTRRGHEVPVASARMQVAAPLTAWIFPGQGIQQQDMGMAGYLRSPAARRVWDRADAHTRAALGFSILRVVRENPRELVIAGERLTHPKGVIHLTQLTQVAMAVLAYAQVAELEEQGVYTTDGVIAGHSVGEYNALSAAAKVLPLEAVVAIVYQRGRVMHGLVPRDARGDSGFRMGVIRPHYAGLDHAAAEALVAAVSQRTGRFLEIVNYNVRGRQYSVTGHADALVALEAALEQRRRPGAKPPYVEVPGVDVPFHSRRLRDGVADFRAALERHLPAEIDPDRLVGRYIPNLVALPFALTTAFVRVVRDAVDGPSRERLDDVLAHWERELAAPRRLTRLLLVELLAWQFASPVRWITTQEAMFAPRGDGGLGVRRVVEVGVGYQPTLAGMARYTLQLLSAAHRVEVLNAEADRAVVFAEDTDPAPAAPSAEAAGPADAPTEAAPAPTSAAPAAVAPGAIATERPADAPLGHAEALTTLLALQAKVRGDQVSPTETIDALFDGVSSRRNQVLIDLGAEFDLGTIDRAHETAIGELAQEIARRTPGWRAPGGYLAQAHDEAVRRALGRAGFSAKDAAAYLDAEYGFGPGLVVAALDALAREARGGASARGGELGALGDEAPATKAGAKQLLDRAVESLAKRRGTTYGRQRAAGAGAGGGVVDAAAVQALEERLLGKEGALFKAAAALAKGLGHDLEGAGRVAIGDPEAADAADLAREELGAELAELVAPQFDAQRHVAFLATWAAAQRDMARLVFDRLNGRIDDRAVDRELARLAPHAAEPRVLATARWFSRVADERGLPGLAAALATFGDLVPVPPPTLARLAAEPWLGEDAALRELLSGAARSGLDFRGRTALVTGASPGSIAIAIVELLLRGGARVVATTTSASRERLAFYRATYERCGAHGAELHVVPMNQASFGDVEALVDWLFREETEQNGATVRVLKPAFTPDLLIPFAAMKDFGTADQVGGRAEAALRGMVFGTERLIGAIARRRIASGGGGHCHVLLPLSPNHGAFGGDGAYAESKAALEVLLPKWSSEREAWGRATTLVGARIGWVRGTGLMAGNDQVAPRLEAETGMRTFATEEMGAMLTALCGDAARAAAERGPVVADLTGGFTKVADLKGTVDGIRASLDAGVATDRRVGELAAAERARLREVDARPARVAPLPMWPVAPAPEADLGLAWPGAVAAKPEELVVIVGFGEVGPGGSARTRFELEVEEHLSAPAVLELAWLTGLVRFEESARGGSWIDTESGEPVAERDLAARYHDAVKARTGVRFIEPETCGFDAERTPVLQTVYLEQDFTFRAASEEEARSYAAADPAGTRLAYDEAAEAWLVTRAAGTAIRVPRAVRLSRRVGGQLPRGFDLARFGFGGEMLENVDPIALMNVAATVDAFVAAGTTPEELLSFVHPARVATTQGSGMGGMRSLHRLYVDHLLGAERQSDMLQETLINVVFAYVATAYVGSYGAMAHPVAACATAALSIEDAVDKIQVGKADVVLAGGWDDLSEEGTVGFGDMNATANTDQMLAMGLAPDQFSRANDRRRRGFIEAQGGGSLLLAKGDVALAMGLPVYGVVAYAGSFGDGINRSIPAPGIGATAAALGGADSPLGRALARLGLGADDIAVVSKHDTSTNANDPNEAGLHHGLQEALGRTPGNPLMVISQKTLTGHAKGGAAAWQAIGLCQALAAGVVPPNRNLEAIDPGHERYRHLLFTNLRLDPGPACPMRAGLLTSLGFGHVSALVCIAHPAAFAHALTAEARATWTARAAARRAAARDRWARVLVGREPLYDKRVDRRFAAHDGTDAQKAEETAMLLDPGARFDPAVGHFVPGRGAL